MNKLTKATYKLEEVAQILECDVEDILENWSLGNLYICINLLPSLGVYTINNQLLSYIDKYSLIRSFVEYDKSELEHKDISGLHYVPPALQKEKSKPFVQEDFPIDAKSSLSFDILIPAEKFDGLVNNNKLEYLNMMMGSFMYQGGNYFDYYSKESKPGFLFSRKHLRITKSELERIKCLNLFGNNSSVIQPEIKDNERNNLLMTIGALTELYAHEKGAAFKSGDKPNISRVTENVLKYLNNDIYGLGKSALHKRCSDGVKLLQKVKKDS